MAGDAEDRRSGIRSDVSDTGSWALFLAVSADERGAGWAWRLVRDRATVGHGVGFAPSITSARAELHALIDGLGRTPTDAALRVHGANPAWSEVARSGRRRSGHRSANADLLRRLQSAVGGRDVDFAPAASTHADQRWVRAQAREARRAAPPDAAPPPAVEPVRPGAAPAATSSGLVAYTDGGCRGNPGPGGWGFVLVHLASGVTLEARGGSQYTTNNRMELQAAIGALEALTRPGQEVEIRTDSSYLRDLASQWLPGWKRRGWKRPTGEPVANLDQVQRLDELLVAHRVRWTKVKGHSGEPGNERADRLAADAMDALAAGTEPAWTNRLSAPPFRINGR